jgi:hypothetical protein
LLPRARSLAEDELLITDGFSCHEQVLQQTGKRAAHLAEVVQSALRTGQREEPQKPAQRKDQTEAEGKLLHKQRDGHARMRWIAPVSAAALAAAAIAYLAEHKD